MQRWKMPRFLVCGSLDLPVISLRNPINYEGEYGTMIKGCPTPTLIQDLLASLKVPLEMKHVCIFGTFAMLSNSRLDILLVLRIPSSCYGIISHLISRLACGPTH